MWLLCAVPACYGGERNTLGECPPGETCSPATPAGLQFIPPGLFDDFLVASDSQIAVGGTTTIDLEYQPTITSDAAPLALPYTADDGVGPAVRVAGTQGSILTLRGAAVGSNEIRIVDPGDGSLFDRKVFAASSIDHVAIDRQGFERTATGDVVYATPTAHVGIVLTAANGTRLVDTSLTVAGATREVWDSFAIGAPSPGTYTIAVSAAGLPPASFDIVAVDHADTIVPVDVPATIAVNQSAQVCFGAQLGGHSVVGLAWTITVDGAAADPELLAPSCGMVHTTKTSGAVTLVASAGGVSTTVNVPIGAATRLAPAAHTTRTTANPAGERAMLAD